MVVHQVDPLLASVLTRVIFQMLIDPPNVGAKGVGHQRIIVRHWLT
jgi:hypothetical protein